MKVSYFEENRHLFGQQVCRIYLRSREFQILSQQLDIDFLVFEILRKQEVQLLNIQAEDPSVFNSIDQLQFLVAEKFIPLTI